MSKTRQRNYVLNYTIILMVCLVSYGIRTISGQFDAQINFILFPVSVVLVAVSWEALNGVNIWLNRVYPFERSLYGRIAIQLSIGVAFGLITRFVLYKIGEPYLPVQLDTMFLAATWALYVLGTTCINAIFFVSYFVTRWKESIVRAERLEKEKSQVQFDNLKNQLNPHFLFNALTSLNGLIFEDQKLASDFLQQLSKVYRYVLQHSDKNSVPLQTELDFIRSYIQLVETRFSGALKINLKTEHRSKDMAIVPVTLQVLIENAIKHNIIDPEKPLMIDIETNETYLTVSNNLQIRKTVDSSNNLGIERLRSLYGFMTTSPVIVEVTSERFSVKIPLI